MQIFFSQGVAVLCSQVPGLASLRHLLERHGYTITADEDTSEWPEMQGAGFTLKTDFESGAACQVDICEFLWPDDMGATGEPTLLTSAHALGAFGPFVHPGAFARALQAPGYQSVAASASGHSSFVRFRISNLIPATGEVPEAQFANIENANSAEEHLFLLRAAASLVDMPEALAYFNPGSELLLPLDGLGALLAGAVEQKTFPVEAVCRVRGCPVDANWSFIDCLGMEQLGRRDHEFAWPGNELDRNEQIDFLLSLMRYELSSGAAMSGGHTTDGPQNILWRAEERDSSCMMPSRRVLHWTMDNSPPEPEQLKAQTSEPDSSSVEDQLSPQSREVLAKLEAWQQQKEAIRLRAVQWLLSPEFKTVYYDDAHVPQAVKHDLERELSKKEAAETWRKIQFLGQQTPQLWSQYQQLASQGQVWYLSSMMTNPNFEQNPNSLLPCGVIAAVKQSSLDIMIADAYAEIAYELYAGQGDAAQYPITARLMSDDSYKMFQRESFPLDETRGYHLMLLSVLMKKTWMPPADVPFVPFLAMPGPQGAIFQIPWHIVAGTPAIPGSMSPGRFAGAGEPDRAEGQVAAEQKSKRFGCWNVISLIIWAVFLTGILGGIFLAIFDKPARDKKSPSNPKKNAPAEHSKPQ